MSESPTSSFLEIDQHALDEEWLNQPLLAHEHAVLAADAQQVLDELKAELEVCLADTAEEIREEPTEFGLKKVTEKGVEQAIEQQPEVRALRKKIIKATHAMRIHFAAVTAIEHRKRALEHLVELFMADYYSKPQAKSAGSREKMEEHEKSSLRRRGQFVSKSKKKGRD